jgi:hypothetical protein
MELKKSAVRVASFFLKEAGYSEELKMGIEVEKEHADVYKFFEEFLKKNDLKMPITIDEFATMIAKAHLKEAPTEYYTKLEDMEKGFKK